MTTEALYGWSRQELIEGASTIRHAVDRVGVGLGETLHDAVACYKAAFAQGMSPHYADVRLLAREGSGAFVTDASLHLHWAARWHLFGCPTFRLTHSLASALVLTDPGGLRGADVRFPFPSFLVELPFPGSPIVYGDAGVGAELVEGRYLFVHRYRGYFHPIDSGASFDALARDSAKSDCEALLLRASNPSSVELFDRQRMLSDEEPIERWIQHSGSLAHDSFYELGDRDHRAITAMRRLTINLAVYIAALAEEPLASEHPRRGPMGNLPPIELGREVKLPRSMRDAARAFCLSDRDPVAYRIRSRFVVRGHWRRQACGKGRTVRRMRWIAPFWKGPTTAAELERVYAVMETT